MFSITDVSIKWNLRCCVKIMSFSQTLRYLFHPLPNNHLVKDKIKNYSVWKKKLLTFFRQHESFQYIDYVSQQFRRFSWICSGIVSHSRFIKEELNRVMIANEKKRMSKDRLKILKRNHKRIAKRWNGSIKKILCLKL